MNRNFDRLGVILEHRVVGTLDIWHFNKPKAPFSAYLNYATGAFDDSIPGITHFLEHMLVSGTKNFPTKKALADYCVDRGWDKNAYTSKLQLFFPIWANDINDIQPTIALLSEYLNNSVFNPETIEKERTAIFDEIQRALSNTDRMISEKRVGLLYPDSPLARMTLGTKETVRGITREHLLEALEIVKKRPKSLLTIGDCAIEKVLEVLPTELVNTESKQPTRQNLRMKSGTFKSTISSLKGTRVEVCYSVDGNFEDRTYKVINGFLSYLLFVSNGLLPNKLRYEKGLTYAVSNSSFSSPQYGIVGASITCSKEKVEEVIQETISIFETAVFDQITEESRRKYLDRKKTRELKDWESSLQWPEKYGFDLLYLKDKTVFHDEHEAILMSLSINEIKETIRAIFHPENRAVITFVGQD